MAPKTSASARGAKRNDEVHDNDSASPITSQDSQEMAMKDIHRLMEQHTRKVKERRKNRKNEILRKNADGMQRLRHEVELRQQYRKQRISAIRRPLIEQLIKLIRKKQETNSRMAGIRNQLLRATQGATVELIAVVEDRMQSLSK